MSQKTKILLEILNILLHCSDLTVLKKIPEREVLLRLQECNSQEKPSSPGTRYTPSLKIVV